VLSTDSLSLTGRPEAAPFVRLVKASTNLQPSINQFHSTEAAIHSQQQGFQSLPRASISGSIIVDALGRFAAGTPMFASSEPSSLAPTYTVLGQKSA